MRARVIRRVDPCVSTRVAGVGIGWALGWWSDSGKE